jgi:phthiocerol/phenolphthiocerol synthesis type-I polyketide synthase E
VLDDDLIAIVGMAGRFPGSPSVAEFWANSLAGAEGVSFYGRDELIEAGEPAELVDDPAYVPASAPLADHDRFDAELFGYSPREARVMDPQQRVFLESAWEALEDAACDPDRLRARIGVFAGTGMTRYLWQNVVPALGSSLNQLEARLLNDKDFLATTTSYKLNLRGPSVNVQTACSTSLVAVHLAAQSLLSHECDLALAGGVTIELPHRVGYLYQEGGVNSPDGHCLPFDHRAAGCVGGSGVGVVVLQRLGEARAQHRRVHAVLRGSAVNNDGSGKVGFTAPSVTGQAAVIRDALFIAEAKPESIGYVETHGTGTPIGDPIEVEALRGAFDGVAAGSVALGSTKASIGHLDAAAGIAGLIRAVLAVREGVLPPSPYFQAPNPLLELDGSPFYLPTTASAWPRGATPRRAGVSSFGMGGTNAHVVVEQPPAVPDSAPDVPGKQLLVLSAASERALEAWRLRLADAMPDDGLADVAHTLATGRRRLPHRLAVVADSPQQAADRLRDVSARRIRIAGDPPSVVFLFPGQGAQRPGMAADLHRVAPVFRTELDRCAELFERHGVHLRDPLLDADSAPDALRRTDLAQPALFAHSYALARQWEHWGVTPSAMAGHSVGEYVAACLAGVLDLPDAVRLVARRGALMAALPSGSMLAVALPEDEAVALLVDGVELAAVNGPRQCVLSGRTEAIERLHGTLSANGVRCKVLETSHAFHSAMLDPVLKPFEQEVRRTPLRPPSIPFTSCVTGGLIEPGQATDPAYWARQARRAVRFGDALDLLAADPGTLFVEVGAGRGMAELARRHLRTLQHAPISSLPLTGGDHDEQLLAALGQAWEHGVDVDWAALHEGGSRRVVALPGYPFTRKRHWITAPGRSSATTAPVDEPAPVAAKTGQAATSDAEAVVIAVFREAFGVDDIGPQDDFFGLGGTSLLAAEVVHRLRKRFAVEFPVRYLFEAPGVADLAALISGTDQGDAEDDLDALVAELSALPDHEIAHLLADGTDGVTR